MSFYPGQIVRQINGDPLEGVTGIIEKVGNRQCQVNFIRLPWTAPAAVLPEARNFPHDHLVECRDPWSDALSNNLSSIEELMLRVKAAELWLGNVHGQLGNARTDLLPHQVCLVHDVLEREKRRLIIAEEVGMGKTIETGMIMHAMNDRRELNRCLVVCPAGQIRQWQEELESKLRLRFEIYRQDVDGRRAFSFPFVIASLDTVKLETPVKHLNEQSHRDILLDAPDWDLVVFDEAHRLAARDYGNQTAKTLNYRLAEHLCERTKHFLFLTGTPHDGNSSKFRNLLRALDQDVVFSKNEEGNYFGNLILKNRKSEAINAEGQLLFKQVEVKKISLAPLEDGEAEFHLKLRHYLRTGYGVAEIDLNNPKNRAIGFVMTTFQKLATSSIAAVRHSLLKRLQLIENPDHNSKGDESVFDDLDDRYEGEVEALTTEKIQEKVLREKFSEIEANLLRELVQFNVPNEVKWEELARLVSDVNKKAPSEKLLIFTEYRKTVAFLKEKLEELYGDNCVSTIMGGMSPADRKNVIDRFKSDLNCRFLISTEAGGEGINLQFCNLVVNYDLPWNPFRVVQRIGRVHRIGQLRNMRVFNLQIRNELDERLTTCHEERVSNAVDALTEVTNMQPEDIQDQLLGFAQEFINYESVYSEALLQGDSRQSEIKIAKGIKEATETFRLAYETVFRHSVSPFNPDRFKSLIGEGLVLKDLQSWLERYLKTQNRRLMRRESEDLWEFLMPQELKINFTHRNKAVKGTFDRKKAIQDNSIELLAIGHPEIDLLLRHALAPDSVGAFIVTESNIGKKVPHGTACVVLQEENHAGANACRLIALEWDKETGCQLLDRFSLGQINSAKGFDAVGLIDEMKSSMFNFLEENFSEIDFIGDRLYWIALCLSIPQSES